MMDFPQDVEIVEVGPRDGLQNESACLSPPQRVLFIESLVESGVRTIEIGSFVSPKWVPQMAGTGEIYAAVKALPDIEMSALVPNMYGFKAAKAAGLKQIAVFAAASESFSKKNINASIAESLQRYEEVVTKALQAGIRVRGYVSCVLGCPYEGDVPLEKVVQVSKALLDMGCYEVSLGDTIGVGTPLKAIEMIRAVAAQVPIDKIAVHFHDTYGQALANILACLSIGVSKVDSSAGGLGGCPYAQGASGNVATEDVVYMLNGMGIQTGIDLNKLVLSSQPVFEQLGRVSESRVHRQIRAQMRL